MKPVKCLCTFALNTVNIQFACVCCESKGTWTLREGQNVTC